MSRIFPEGYKTGECARRDLLAWFVIMADGAEAGTIWLEKAQPEDDLAILGIFLSSPDLLGKGIGRAAVRLAIAAAQPSLRFQTVRLRVRAGNERAIRCYLRCGFEKVSEFEKVRPTGKVETIYVMERAAY